MPLAEAVSLWSNWLLVVALVVGALSTLGVVVSANVKERYWQSDREQAAERVSANEAETARARESAAQADARAAEANAKAETERVARLELEARLAPRSLTIGQQQALIDAIRPFAPQAFEFVSFQDDLEVVGLVQTLVRTLVTAGWVGRPATGFLMAAPVVAVSIEYSPDKAIQFAPAASALALALSRLGIAASSVSNPELGADWGDRLRIKVGKKP